MENVSPFDDISRAIKNDPEYAWAVHCQLACNIFDELPTHLRQLHSSYHVIVNPHLIANRAATRCMQALFGFDSSQLKHYKDFGEAYQITSSDFLGQWTNTSNC